MRPRFFAQRLAIAAVISQSVIRPPGVARICERFMENNAHVAITLLLKAASGGDRQAAEQLLPLLYDELRKLARSRLAKCPPGQTLQPTALVHEAYLRVVKDADPRWDGRGHFFGAAARAMRDILVEQARRKGAQKRGGGANRVDVEDVDLAIEAPSDDVVALDEALRRLEVDDPRKGQIVNLRYFAGLTIEETAEAVGVSVGTINREWDYIRRWLFLQLTRNADTRNTGR